MSFNKKLNTKSNIFALIPARAGSQSIKDKNLQQIKGHPIMAYAIAVARLSKKISRVFVSTNSDEYAKVAISYGAEVPFLRPNNISTAESTDIEFFSHFLNWMKANENLTPELIVHLRPTSPLRQLSIVENAIEFMEENETATSLRSCETSVHTPFKSFYEENGFMKPILELTDHEESYNLPRQRFPVVYVPNGHVDIVKPNTLFSQNSLHGKKMKLWLTESVPDIDTITQLDYAKYVSNSDKYRYLIEYLDYIKAG